MPKTQEPWGKLQRSPPAQLEPVSLCEAPRLTLVALSLLHFVHRRLHVVVDAPAGHTAQGRK